MADANYCSGAAVPCCMELHMQAPGLQLSWTWKIWGVCSAAVDVARVEAVPDSCWPAVESANTSSSASCRGEGSHSTSCRILGGRSCSTASFVRRRIKGVTCEEPASALQGCTGYVGHTWRFKSKASLPL